MFRMTDDGGLRHAMTNDRGPCFSSFVIAPRSARSFVMELK
jgi:hypothetical protein